MRMLNYDGINSYDKPILKNTAKAIIVLDLNEKSFMVQLLADLTQSNPALTIANDSFYKSYIL